MIRFQAALNNISETLLHAATAGAVGYLGANIFSFNPFEVAATAAGAVVISHVIKPIFTKIFDGPTANHSSRLLGNILNITASVASAASIATFFTGVKLTATAFVCLNAFTICAFALVALGIITVRAVNHWRNERLHEEKQKIYVLQPKIEGKGESLIEKAKEKIEHAKEVAESHLHPHHAN